MAFIVFCAVQNRHPCILHEGRLLNPIILWNGFILDGHRHKNAASYKTMRQIGGPRGIRTLDLSDANRTLSQLSYRPILMTLIVYRVLGRLSSNFGERKRGTYKRPSCQKATALAAATLRESTPWDMGIFTV